MTVFAALLSAVTLHVFVYKNKFAPSGVDGIATMLQEEFPMVNGGIFLFALNAPLLVLSIVFLDRKFTIYTIISIVSLSVFLVLLELLDNKGFINQYHSNEKLLPAIFSGLMLKRNSASSEVILTSVSVSQV